MNVGFSLLTSVGGAGTGTGAYVRGLLDEFVRGNGPEATTVLIRDTEAPRYASLQGERLRLVTTPSRGKLGTAAVRLPALLPPCVPARRLRSSLEQLDLLHYPLTIPVPRTRLPYVQTLHDVQHHDLPQLFSRAQRTWRRVAYDGAARQAALVITDSRHAKGRIVERLGIDPDRIEVAHLGVDTARFSPEPGPGDEAALAALELPPRFLLYPAALWPHKNHRRLLDALGAATDPELGLVLTGPVFGRLAELQAAIARRALDRRVTHLGFVAPDAVPALYRRAVAVVFPSLYEGFGSPPLEAMACGCPVAASTAGSLPEICGDAALMFDPTSTDAIAETIDRIADDAELRCRLRVAGAARIREFTWESAARRHRSAFEHALGGH